ncbi:hypothetical protein GOB19_23375 [Sinorhizobium meliloti]|nr:hypothetical protein [Sinorhizobium meliloti]MDX0307837.1 hypothetical protein [Sinorhizobium meliloti]MDX0376893.1 hypothetical protein [Sinorhizobium meliloti]
MKRAALLIGVDNASQFPPLKAAVSGAKSVSEWLAAEGYQTTLLTDENGGAVAVHDVKAALKSIVERGDTEKLVVYFSGHGLLNGLSELWLLSDAAHDIDEVIDVSRNVEAARTCGVKSVVFISDACRLLPGTVSQSRTSGAMIFPAMNDYSVDVEVDRFFATRPGMAALEMSSGQVAGPSDRDRYVGIFTEALRDIHTDPDATLIGPVTIEGKASVAVLSRKLKTWLPHVVDGRAQDKSLSLRQQPQLVLECGDDGYVAKPTTSKGGITHESASQRYRGTVSLSLNRSILNDFSIPVPLRDEASFRDFRDRARPPFPLLGKTVGATIIGKPVVSAFSPDVEVEVVKSRRFTQLRVRAEIVSIISIVARFVDGTGAVIGIVPKHHTTVMVEPFGISNVLFEFAAQDWDGKLGLVLDYGAMASEVATAANFGMFPESREDAQAFANSSAPFNNPTLTLYAVMGLVEVGLRSKVSSLTDKMAWSKSSALFDLCLHVGSWSVDAGPFCPLLSQTWAFLEKDIKNLPDNIVEAGRYRQASLWTAFTSEGMDFIERAREAGELQWQRS